MEEEVGHTLHTRHMRAASDFVDVPLTSLLRASLTVLALCGFDLLTLGVELPTLLAGLTSVASFFAQETVQLPATRAFPMWIGGCTVSKGFVDSKRLEGKHSPLTSTICPLLHLLS